jgi:FKBP-type peptidyl-prolyl cis-trans isomerase FklB
MKRILGIVVAVVIVLSSCKHTASNVSLKSETDSLSYIIGVYFAAQVKNDVSELNVDAVAKGFDEYYKVDTFKMNPTEINAELNKLFGKLQKRAADKNKVESQKMLDENKKKSGVVTLPSGLQYKVEKEGTGPMPDSSDVVNINYTGRLTNGEEFDSNAKTGQPAKFPVTGVIPGFTQALLKMKVGSKWKVFIPSELAYGEQGTRGKIKSNMALIFDLELLSIEPKPTPEQIKQQQQQQQQQLQQH